MSLNEADLLRASAQDMRLHSACVSRDGRGALLVGASGAGKSSLSTALALRDWDLVADDWVWLPTSERALGGGLPVSLTDAMARALGISTDGLRRERNGKWSVPMTQIGTTALETRPTIIALVHQSGSSPSLDVSLGQAVHDVAAQWMIDPPMREFALLETLALIARCHVIQVPRSSAADVDDALRHLLDTPPPPRRLVVLQQPDVHRRAGVPWKRSDRGPLMLCPQVAIAQLDDWVVLHQPFGGSIVTMNGAASAVCSHLLAGPDTVDAMVKHFVKMSGSSARQVEDDLERILMNLGNGHFVIAADGDT